MNFRVKLLLLALLASWLVACSSSKTKDISSDDEDAALFTNSSADAVGSIPEDALLSAESDGGTSTPVDAPEVGTEKASDAFADLSSASTTDVSPGEPSSGFSSSESYVVQKGDTLMKVAFSIYGDVDRWKDIYENNKSKLKNGGNRLKAGMILKYDNPSTAFELDRLAHTYEIKKGDTLAGIAEDLYGKRKKYRKLQKYNAKLIKNPHVIFAGFTLYYDITEQEVAEAEAHRKWKMARKEAGAGADSGSVSAVAPVIPSAINPPIEATVPPPAPVAIVPAPASVPQQAPTAVLPAPVTPMPVPTATP